MAHLYDDDSQFENLSAIVAQAATVLGEVFCKIKTLRGLFAMFRSQQTVKFRSKKKKHAWRGRGGQ